MRNFSALALVGTSLFVLSGCDNPKGKLIADRLERVFQGDKTGSVQTGDGLSTAQMNACVTTNGYEGPFDVSLQAFAAAMAQDELSLETTWESTPSGPVLQWRSRDPVTAKETVSRMLFKFVDEAAPDCPTNTQTRAVLVSASDNGVVVNPFFLAMVTRLFAQRAGGTRYATAAQPSSIASTPPAAERQAPAPTGSDPASRDASTTLATPAAALLPAARDTAPPAVVAPQAPVEITNPDWRRKPSPEDIAQYYPEAAGEAGVSGRATIACRVTAAGRLQGCAIVSEEPAGYEFGQAAIRMSAGFRMAPMQLDGRAVSGGLVRIPIRFGAP